MFLPQDGARRNAEELQRTEYELRVLEGMARLAAALVKNADVNAEADAATSALARVKNPRTVTEVVDALDGAQVPLRFRRVRPTAPTAPLRGAELRAALESVTRPLAEELLARSLQPPEGCSTYRKMERALYERGGLRADDPDLFDALTADLGCLGDGIFAGPAGLAARDTEGQWNAAVENPSSPDFGAARVDTVDDRHAREAAVVGEKATAIESLRRLFAEVPPPRDDSQAVETALDLLDRVAQAQRQRSRQDSDDLLAQVTREVFEALSLHVKGQNTRTPLVTTRRILTACALEVAGLDDAPNIDTDPDGTRDRRVERRLRATSAE